MSHTDHSLRVDGAITYWNAGEYTNLAALQEGLAELGLGQFAPGPRTPAAALKDALGDVFKGSDYLVQRLDEQDAFEAVKVTRGDTSTGNSYAQVLVAKLVEQPGGLTIRFAPLDGNANSVTACYNRHLGQVRGPVVTRSLVQVVQHLAGVRLRNDGGVYWLPESALGTWLEVATVAQRAGVAGRCKVFTIQHAFTPDSVRAVRDALVSEVLAESKRLQAEMQDADLGDRALATRAQQAEDLRQKIRQYEAILGEGLGALTEAVDAAEQAEMIGGLLAAGGADA